MFKQLSMQNATACKWPAGLCSQFQRLAQPAVSSPEVRNLKTESQFKAHPSPSINNIKPNSKCSSCFLHHHFNGYVNTKPQMRSYLQVYSFLLGYTK